MAILKVKSLVFFLIILSLNAFSQEAYKVKFINESIILDGKFDEQMWKDAPRMAPFQQYFPNDKNPATYDSEIKIVYDDKNIYVSAKLNSKGSKYLIPSFRRDFRAGGNDNFTFNFDTFADRTNAIMFGTNPYGVQREGLVFNGGTDNGYLNMFWDNKWKVATTITADAWNFEAVIPFTTLRFKEGTDTWYFKAYRFDTQSNETSTNVPMPQSQLIMALGYSDKIVFEKPLKKSGANIAIIPYVSARMARDFEKPSNPNNGFKTGIGFDTKIGITSGLNLDLTVNPDFSNVEADRQVVNLTRFDINLPEQRQFFIENSDLFSGFGSVISNPFLPPAGTLSVGNQLYSPFFSRNIGIGTDSVGNSIQKRINYGARISGKLNNTWRIGLLNTQTARDELSNTNAENFSVFAIQKKVLQRSNIAGIFVNKFSNTNAEKPDNGMSSIAGMEFNFNSKDSKWQGKTFYHQAIQKVQKDSAFATGAYISYITNKITTRSTIDWLGQGFEAKVGFVPRNNFLHINQTTGLNYFPKTKLINRYSVGFSYDQYNSKGIGLTDRKAGIFGLLVFQNTMRILMSVNQNYTYLFRNFDVLRSNGKLPSLKKGEGYNYVNFEGNIVTDLRKRVFLNLNPIIGQYYDGNIASFSGTLNYRFMPYGLLAMNYSYNNIKVSKGKNQVYVLGPNLDLTLNKKLFFTNYLQYNSQLNNLNINSRLQYRYAPVSDFFLVYTDNYNSELWMPKNRALFVKFNYWLSL